MAYDGYLNFYTALDTEDFKKDTQSLGNIVKGLGIFKIIEKGMQMVANSIDKAVQRYDTLNNFPKIMQQMGYSAEQSAGATEKLKEGIQGLPTTLDGIVSSTKQLTIATGGLDSGVDTALALNNAFLASGASAEDASRGTTQYIQMLSKGKVDQQSWLSVAETMPYALDKIAQSFGFAGSSAKNDLYAALQSGKITFKDFNERLIELSQGVGGFAELAKTSTGGIGTAWKNMKTAVVSGTAGIITAIDSGLSETKFVSIENIIGKMKDGVSASLNVVAGAFGFVAKNADTLIPITASLFAIWQANKFASYAKEIKSLTDVTGLLTAAENGNIIAKTKVIGLKIKDMAITGSSIIQQGLFNVALLAETIALKANNAATNGGIVAKTAAAVASKVAAAAQWLWNKAMEANPIGLVIAGVVALTALVIGLAAAFKGNSAAVQKDIDNIKSLREANKQYADQLESNKQKSKDALQAKETEMKVNRELVSQLDSYISQNSRSNDLNAAIAETVNTLNDSMGGLGLTYSSTTGELNMSTEAVRTYIDNLEKASRYQHHQSEYNRLLTEQTSLQDKIQAQKDLEIEYYRMLEAGTITRKEYNNFAAESIGYMADLNAALEEVTVQTKASQNAMVTAFDATAIAEAKAHEIKEKHGDEVKKLAKIYGVSAEEIVEQASHMTNGLEDWKENTSKSFTAVGESIDIIGKRLGVSAEEIEAWVEDNDSNLDGFVDMWKGTHTKAGESLDQVATRLGMTSEQLEEYMAINEMTLDAVNDAHNESLGVIAEYGSKNAMTYAQIEAAAKEAGMTVANYVESQNKNLTKSGMDIKQVAEYWRISEAEVQQIIDTYGMDMEEAYQHIAGMHTKSGKTLYALSQEFQMTEEEIKTAAAEMGISWQDYGDKLEADAQKQADALTGYAEKFNMTVEDVKAGIEAMGGNEEKWLAGKEQSLRAAAVAEQEYINQIKEGNVELSGLEILKIEEARINGEELTAVEQAKLDQWKAINEEFIAAATTHTDEIINNFEKLPTRSKLSADKMIKNLQSNREQYSQWQENMKTISGMVSEETMAEIEKLGPAFNKELEKMIKDGGTKAGEFDREVLLTVIQGFETAGASIEGVDLADLSNKELEALIQTLGDANPEIAQKGKEAGEAYGTELGESTAPSEASQEIADNVVEDLANADYSGITSGIASAINTGESEVTASAKSMTASSLTEIQKLETEGETSFNKSMTNLNSSITTYAPTITATTTSLVESIVKELDTLPDKANTSAIQTMAQLNAPLVSFKPTVTSSAKNVADAIAKEINEIVAKGKTSATDMMDGVKSNITAKETTVKSTASTTAKAIGKKFEDMILPAKTAGTNMMKGIGTAMDLMAPTLYVKASIIASTIAATMKTALKVKSPSRVMIDIFTNVMMGIYKGLEGMENKVYSLAGNISKGIGQKLSISPETAMSAVGRLQSISAGNLTNTSRIQPMMALAGVQGGPSYNSYLEMHVTTPKPLSESELTREAQDAQKRAQWKLF